MTPKEKDGQLGRSLVSGHQWVFSYQPPGALGGSVLFDDVALPKLALGFNELDRPLHYPLKGNKGV